MHASKTVLIAPLNWGLGHATRCVPIVRQQIKLGHKVILAADGDALLWLQKEFPDTMSIHLPGFKIKYAKGNSQIGAMLKRIGNILIGTYREHRLLQK